MSGCVNLAILVGNVGRDPEIRSFPGGGRVANLSIATSERWRDKTSGETKEVTQWHRCAVFNDKLVDVIQRFVRKGSKLYVSGGIETRKWADQAGKENYSTEVVLRPFRGELVLLDSAGNNASPPAAAPTPPRADDKGRPQQHGTPALLDDDIPF